MNGKGKSKHHIVVEVGFSAPVTAKQAANFVYRCIAFGSKPEQQTAPAMSIRGTRTAIEGLQVKQFSKVMQGLRATYGDTAAFKKIDRYFGASLEAGEDLSPELMGLLERSQGLPEGALGDVAPVPVPSDPADVSAAFKRATTRFEKACEEMAFIGSQDPEIRPLIEEEHARAKSLLYRACLAETARRAVEA